MKRKANDDGSILSADAIRCFWLNAGDSPFLCIEDTSTGDIFMRLIDMKGIFDQNYSRKLGSLRYRAVTINPDSELAAQGHVTLYWQQAHEAPQDVKAAIRTFMGDDRTQQGHLRIVLLPIVYNAMAANDHLHTHPLYLKFLDLLPGTKYWTLLKHAPAVSEDPQPARPGAPFTGPTDVLATCTKHMTGTASEDGQDAGGSNVNLLGGAGPSGLLQPAPKRLATGLPSSSTLNLDGAGNPVTVTVAIPPSSQPAAPVGAAIPSFTNGLRARVQDPSPLTVGSDPHLAAAIISLEREVKGMRGDLDTSLAVMLAETITLKRIFYELITEVQKTGFFANYDLDGASKFGGSGLKGGAAAASGAQMVGGGGAGTVGAAAGGPSALAELVNKGKTQGIEAAELVSQSMLDSVLHRVGDNVGVPYFPGGRSIPKQNGPGNPFNVDKVGMPAMLLGLMGGAAGPGGAGAGTNAATAANNQLAEMEKRINSLKKAQAAQKNDESEDGSYLDESGEDDE